MENLLNRKVEGGGRVFGKSPRIQGLGLLSLQYILESTLYSWNNIIYEKEEKNFCFVFDYFAYF